MTQAPSLKTNLSHEERTASEPRAKDLHVVTLNEVKKVNDRIQTYRLGVKDDAGIKFLAGQWVDLHIPGIEKAGGFTITSTPKFALARQGDGRGRFLTLAVQNNPDNPAAAWLWQPSENIRGTELHVRVGGSFVWPPAHLPLESIDRVVLIAGGVGINPLDAIMSQILEQEDLPLELSLFYSSKLPSANSQASHVLALSEAMNIYGISGPARRSEPKGRLELFLTGTWDGTPLSFDNGLPLSLKSAIQNHGKEATVSAHIGRIDEPALERALGDPNQRQSSVFYVCGPPQMTDSIVEYLGKQENVSPERVLCEKWW